MLKATISADIFKDTVDALSALVTECRLHFTETEVWARAVDTANVAMAKYNPSIFRDINPTKIPRSVGTSTAKIKDTSKGNSKSTVR